MKLSDGFYNQLNSIKDFSLLDYDDPQVVAIRSLADHELKNTNKGYQKQYVREIAIYNFYEKGKVVASGTASEIAKITGHSKATIGQYGTPGYIETIDKSFNKYTEKLGFRM